MRIEGTIKGTNLGDLRNKCKIVLDGDADLVSFIKSLLEENEYYIE